jgi:hypothetical protein
LVSWLSVRGLEGDTQYENGKGRGASKIITNVAYDSASYIGRTLMTSAAETSGGRSREGALARLAKGQGVGTLRRRTVKASGLVCSYLRVTFLSACRGSS